MIKMDIKQLPHHLFELAVALTWVVIGTAYLIDPHSTLTASPVGDGLGSFWPSAWGIMEVLGGFTTLWGLGRIDPGLRAAGLCLLGAGLGMHGIGAVYSGIELRDLTYWIMCGACTARVFFIYKWEGNENGTSS